MIIQLRITIIPPTMSKEKITIAVGPTGEWGSAFALVLARKGHNIRGFSNHPEDLIVFQKTRRTRGLADSEMPHDMKLYTDVTQWIDKSELIVISTSVQGFRPFVQRIKSAIPPKSDILLLPKGLEGTTHKRMSEIMLEELPDCRDHLAVLAGPNQAKEVARGELTGAVVAAYDQNTAKRIQKWINSDRFWVYTSGDVAGVEYGAAFKNIASMVAGVADGYRLASSTKAFLQTRMLEEIITLSTAIGKPFEPLVALPLTLIGLAGIGDQLLSYGSDTTRNHRAGMRLVEGWSLKRIETEELREGIYTLKSAYELARIHKIHTPIIDNLYEWLYTGVPKDIYQLIGAQPHKEKFSDGDFTFRGRTLLSGLLHKLLACRPRNNN